MVSPVEMREEVEDKIPVKGLALREIYALQHKALYLGTREGKFLSNLA